MTDLTTRLIQAMKSSLDISIHEAQAEALADAMVAEGIYFCTEEFHEAEVGEPYAHIVEYLDAWPI